MAPRTFIETPRLRLREFVPADVPAVVQLHRDPRVRELLIDDHPLDEPASARQFIHALGRVYRLHRGYGIWHGAVADAGAWRYCGWFNLLPLEDGPAQGVEIGCRLLPSAWGTGLPLECGQMLLDHAFGRLALPEVLSFCHPRHRAVKLQLLALGFEPQGEQDYSGQRACRFALRPAQWSAVRPVSRRERLRGALRQLAAL